MVLRSSISNTKKFFKKTLHNFKSFFSSGYHRLPKTPPSDYKEKEVYCGNHIQKMKEMEIKIREEYYGKKDSSSSSSSLVRDHEERNICEVERKLREMEMLDMGNNNVDYSMDIEEVLYYYSKLTCPAYLHMVDSFFMQIYYSDFFLPISKLDH